VPAIGRQFGYGGRAFRFTIRFTIPAATQMPYWRLFSITASRVGRQRLGAHSGPDSEKSV
jgi:hypothetical protein